MNKKGFTLIELLAVIVVLGIIMTVAGTAVLNQKRNANLEEAKKIEKTLADLGSDVYLSNKESDRKYYLDDLVDYGLKKATIKNPNGNGNCEGYLEIDSELNFSGHVCCPGLYATDMNEKPTEDNCKSYKKTN